MTLTAFIARVANIANRQGLKPEVTNLKSSSVEINLLGVTIGHLCNLAEAFGLTVNPVDLNNGLKQYTHIECLWPQNIALTGIFDEKTGRFALKYLQN
ncbi:hypothetical protein [Vibrio superstes]|uniref:Uncharacterized protein n=1 Tax=Vibrio superstes NBRC 103154 TaxID=1219062 RepID=A0A511QT71_9VIBR|nr:hypothetical protein [Vibrio superstes]GEM80559.1 hypothetical protein VSU01S_28040 [Vibrio superstes NBRC 103154]